jgi:hypothetical protein
LPVTARFWGVNSNFKKVIRIYEKQLIFEVRRDIINLKESNNLPALALLGYR